ncbi:hypothetical protein ACOM2C_07540 [Pseudarthrobacter sp. So.54]
MSRHAVWVDALGELAGTDGALLWWDTANPVPTLIGITPSSDSTADAGTTVIAGRQVLSLPGGVTGIGDAWMASGWRAARPTDQSDPWAVLGAATISDPAPGGSTGGMTGAGPAGLVVGAEPELRRRCRHPESNDR